MTARPAAFAVLVATALLAPGVGHAATPRSGCTPGLASSTNLNHDFVVLRFADGHLAYVSGRTDSLGRVSLDLSIPRTAAAGAATAVWSATERVSVPCGPRVDSYGERTLAAAVRVTR